MIITCQGCQARFHMDDKRIRPEGAKVRCSKCRQTFVVHPPAPPDVVHPPEPPETAAHDETLPIGTHRPQAAHEDDYGPEETIAIGGFPSGTMDGAAWEESAEEPDLTVALPYPRSASREDAGEGGAAAMASMPGAGPAPIPPGGRQGGPAAGSTTGSTASSTTGSTTSSTTGSTTSSTADLTRGSAAPGTPARRQIRYVPFHRKLIYFAVIIILAIGVVAVPVEMYRPILELKKLIGNARSLLSGTEAAFLSEELARMNHFALSTLPETHRNYDRMGTYYYLAFNMLLMESEIPPESQVRQRAGLTGDDFDYATLRLAAEFWRRAFADDPGIRELFAKYKMILRDAKQNARAAGFRVADIYIMIDTGRRTGFFENNIAFLLDGYGWWEEPSYAGEPFEIKPANARWRELALADKTGFENSNIADPNNWYLPHFAKDEWGLWFSVWLTKKTGAAHNAFTIDFDASSVKKLLMEIAGIVGTLILVLAVLVFFIARWLSGQVIKPITELTRGANEVSRGNYDYLVPVLKEDEFGDLTRHFNQMTQGQKERLNLMETLKKFLSEELAEMAATSGIVIGGQKAYCTVMFTDFAGFSTITQHMNATESVNVLNAYFESLIPIIKKYGGFPDKYIGDAIVALFGAPVKLEDHAERAVACAVEMQWKMRELNRERRRQGKTVFEMRVGLNSGEVLAGAIGCDQKLEYTSIGETTNLANRMESICEIGHVMIAEGTYTRIKDIFFRGAYISVTPRRMRVKGYPEPVATYRIWVDNIEIAKDPDARDNRGFYIYKETDHQIKHSPDEVKDRMFESEARFL